MAKERTIEDRVRKILVAELGVDEKQVTLDSHVQNDLGADSIDCAEIAIALEDEFGIEEIDLDDIERMPHVKDLIKFFERVEKQGGYLNPTKDEDDGA